MHLIPLPFGRRLALAGALLLVAIAAAAIALGSSSAQARSAPNADTTARAAQAGCVAGNVNGYARVRGAGTIPVFYTSASGALDTRFNCSGASVQVRRTGVGKYLVRFNSNPGTLAIASGNQDGATDTVSGDVDNIVTAGKVTSGPDTGAFRVDVVDADGASSTGGRPQDGPFTILLP